MSCFYAQFAKLLKDATQTAHLTCEKHLLTEAESFFVYYSGHIGVLEKTLYQRFPKTKQIMGEEPFKELVLTYVHQVPPVSPYLVSYGNDFSEFMRPHVSACVYDLSRLESSLHQALLENRSFRFSSEWDLVRAWIKQETFKRKSFYHIFISQGVAFFKEVSSNQELEHQSDFLGRCPVIAQGVER